MLTSALSMLSFALIGAITPGPVNIIATSSGANFGWRKTLPHVSGATLGYVLVVLVSGLGLNSLNQVLPQFTHILQYVGAAFLLYMAFKIATAAAETDTDNTGLNSPPSLAQGALAQLLNPKAWLVAMSGVALFVASQAEANLYLSLFVGLSFVACFVCVGCWAVCGQLISRWLNTPKRLRFFNRTLGAMLALTVTTLFI